MRWSLALVLAACGHTQRPCPALRPEPSYVIEYSPGASDRASVHGELRRADGQPAIGVTVVFHRGDYTASDISDDTGSYSFSDLPPGPYTVLYDHEGGMYSHPVTARMGQIARDRTRALDHAPSLCGCDRTCETITSARR